MMGMLSEGQGYMHTCGTWSCTLPCVRVRGRDDAVLETQPHRIVGNNEPSATNLEKRVLCQPTI